MSTPIKDEPLITSEAFDVNLTSYFDGVTTRWLPSQPSGSTASTVPPTSFSYSILADGDVVRKETELTLGLSVTIPLTESDTSQAIGQHEIVVRAVYASGERALEVLTYYVGGLDLGPALTPELVDGHCIIFDSRHVTGVDGTALATLGDGISLFHMVQTDSAKQPLAGTFEGSRVANFDGIDDFAISSDSLTFNADNGHTQILGYRYVSPPVGADILFEWAESGSDDGPFQFLPSGQEFVSSISYGGSAVTTKRWDAPLPDGTRHVVARVSGPSDVEHQIFVDGIQQTATDGGSSASFPAAERSEPLTLGGRPAEMFAKIGVDAWYVFKRRLLESEIKALIAFIDALRLQASSS